MGHPDEVSYRVEFELWGQKFTNLTERSLTADKNGYKYAQPIRSALEALQLYQGLKCYGLISQVKRTRISYTGGSLPIIITEDVQIKDLEKIVESEKSKSSQ